MTIEVVNPYSLMCNKHYFGKPYKHQLRMVDCGIARRRSVSGSAESSRVDE
jgi:hypothetical protein